MHYWNHIPKKPVYLYYLSPKDFISYPVYTKKINKNVYHWSTKKEVTPLKIEKYMPRDIKKESWIIASKKDWEERKAKWKRKGYFKND